MSRAERHPRIGRLWRRVAALVAIVALAATVVVLVDAADGDFAPAYHLVGSFSAAGQGLHPGSEVDEHGVQIGRVSSISLQGGRAHIVLIIDGGDSLPSDVVATISPQNVFGEDDVTLTVPGGTPAGEPTLSDGGVIRHTAVEDDLSRFFATAGPLLQQLDTNALASLISELADASRGQGPAIAASLDEGTRFADLLSQTSAAQLQALDAFTRFSAAISTIGPGLNEIGSAGNRSLPLFVSAAHAYSTFLATLGSFSDHLSALLTGYEPDIATILTQGGNVTRVLVADQPDLEYLVYGLAQYAYKFAHAGSAATLPDGSRFGYFKTFIEWTDVEKLVCNLIAPAEPGMSFLAPLQPLVSSPGGPIDCSSQIAAFDRAQSGAPSAPVGAGATGPSTGKTSPLPSSSSVGKATSGLSATAKRLVQQLYDELAQPQSPAAGGGNGSLASYLQALLGGS